MRRYGIPSKIINMVTILYDDFECTVVDGQVQDQNWSETGL